MASELGEHGVIQNWRIIAYGVVATAIILSGAILSWAVGPRELSPQEKCANSCGPNKFLSWTKDQPSYLKEKTAIGQPDIYAPPVPEKCECK